MHNISLHCLEHDVINLFYTHCADVFRSAADMAVHLNQKGAHKVNICEEEAGALKRLGAEK